MILSRWSTLSIGIGVALALGTSAWGDSPKTSAYTPQSAELSPRLMAAKHLPELNSQMVSVTDLVVQNRYRNNWSYYVAVPQINVSSEAQRHFPGLISRFNALNAKFAQESQKEAQNSESTLQAEYLEASANSTTPTSLFRSRDVSLLASRLDGEAVSMLIQRVTSYGGAHEEYNCSAVNFKPQSGDIIHLVDLVKDLRALEKYLVEHLEAKYPQADYYGHRETLHAIFSESQDVAQRSRQDSCWIMTERGLEFRFSPYELASYRDGVLSISINANLHPELFTTKARKQYFRCGVGSHGDKELVPVLPDALKQLAGQWRLVSTEVEGDTRSVTESGMVGSLEFKTNGTASYKWEDQYGNKQNASYLKVKIVNEPLYYGFPKDTWSALLFDEEYDIEHRVALAPDGTLQLILENYSLNEEHPTVMLGIFERQKP